MLSSIMTVCIATFVLAAIIGHVALLQAVLAPAKKR
jgi:hypothetical protein